MLMCNVKGCTNNNFPLKIKATSIQKQESQFNPQFIHHILPKLHWEALITTCKDLDISTLPTELPQNVSEDLLKNVHDVVVDLHIQEATLICNNCSRAYPISNGVPNMLLTEDEV